MHVVSAEHEQSDLGVGLGSRPGQPHLKLCMYWLEVVCLDHCHGNTHLNHIVPYKYLHICLPEMPEEEWHQLHVLKVKRK